MAPARRSRARAAANDIPEPSSDPVEANESDLPSLKFNKPISWQAGKPIAEGELVKRLQAFFDELKTIGDSDTFNVESLRPKLSDLAAERLVKHRNRGVQALVTCCFAEALRIFAPNAPFTGKELKELFTLIIEHIIPALADASSPYHSEHLHALRCLEDVESIILISDVPSSTNLLRALFTAAFDVLSGPAKSSGKEITKMTANILTELLTVLVSGANNLPDEVIDIVLAQFLRADPRSIASTSKGKKGAAQVDEKQATLAFRDAPAAYTMAQDICVSNDTRMARYVLRYFSAILLDTTLLTETATKRPQRRKNDIHEEDDILNGPTEEELKELKKAHQLLRELWRAAPSVLQEIVPQLEAELSTENVNIRLMAVETIGDMVAGIGAAGPPSAPILSPAEYPSQSLVSDTEPKSHHFLLTPQSTISFITKYNSTYAAFLSRQNDKSPTIRSALTVGIGRIISTFAGHAGLDTEQEKELLKILASTLVDTDERVRHAAILAIEQCPFDVIVRRLGVLGGVSDENSILANLADRVKDRKLAVRTDATRLLANIWGVAAGTIADGNEPVRELLGAIPTKLFNAYYVNDPDIHRSIDRVLFESLIPLSYPPQKSSDAGAVKNGTATFDADRIRVERILLMINSLDDKSKTVFVNKQQRQPQLAKLMLAFINHCELYNGGVIQAPQGKTDADVEAALHKLIEILASQMPDKQRVADDLKKFAKMHDRRSYNLIRWACAADSEWSKIRKSVREMTKRIEEATSSASSSSSMLDALTSLIYRSSVLIYNKAHVPAIIHFSRTDEKGLGSTAHEVLKEISKTQGEVFSGHVQDLCKTLVADAPSEKKQHRPDAVEDLKACTEFAKKFADQLPQDRKFFVALLNYAKFGQPLAAKYATRILLTTSDKREMYTKEVLNASIQGFEYGAGRYLTRLAALSQVVYYGYNVIEQEDLDAVHEIAIKQVLLNPKASEVSDDESKSEWAEQPDENTQAKLWALKILVNTLRAIPDEQDININAAPSFKLLTVLITKKGQVSSKVPAPVSHTGRLRLSAAHNLLKLARERRYNELIIPTLFNALSLSAQDGVVQVRTSFVKKVMKYLGQGKLPNRFYTPLFLLAHEPVTELRRNTEIWVQSRAQAFTRDNQMILELIIARLISLLAHHPDFEAGDSDEQLEMAQYFVFYMKAVANAENVSLIFHIAQRVKNLADGITPGSTNIYVLSDLAQAIIRRWEEQKDWNMRTWTERVNLPQGIFAALTSSEESQAIANKMHVPADVLDALDAIVRAGVRTKKSKDRSRAENGGKSKKRVRDPTDKKSTPSKRRKSDGARKKRAERWDADDSNVLSSERRRSGRSRATTNYHEDSASDDEQDEATNGASAENGRSTRQKPVEISSDLSDASEMDED